MYHGADLGIPTFASAATACLCLPTSGSARVRGRPFSGKR